MNIRKLAIISCLCLLFLLPLIPHDSQLVTHDADANRTSKHYQEYHLTGQINERAIRNVFVLGIEGASIPSHHQNLAAFLSTRAIPTEAITTAELTEQPSPFLNASVVVLDASVGSNNGSAMSNELVRVLLASDVPVIMMGKAAWVLHRLRGTDPPGKTATSETLLHPAKNYAEAVFLSYPNEIKEGVILANNAVHIPIDEVQTPVSRLENLTSSTSKVPFLRYDSYPLDSFLFASETLEQLTSDGKALLENVVCFAASMSEDATAQAISEQQRDEGLLAGGFWYSHEATITSTFLVARSAKSIYNTSQWNDWISNHTALVTSILSATYADLGGESAFTNSRYESYNELATAEGLWLVVELGLSAQFDVSGLATYLASQQQADGGFANDVITTYHVLESLASADEINRIDTGNLEDWLRECQIKGTETSDPDCWGGIGLNPDATIPRNSYAAACVLSLEILGLDYQEPTMLVQWIQQKTSNSDGSYNNSLGNDAEITAGTAFALITMDSLNMLSQANRTNGISWLQEEQHASGGFGLGFSDSDIVAKTAETWPVALCVESLRLHGGQIGSGIADYLQTLETSIGFEAMEPVASMLWTDQLAKAMRYSHPSDINRSGLLEYLSVFDSFAMYPVWDNLTPASSLEYGYDQYRLRSVWSNLFGVEAFLAAGHPIPSGVISQTTNYITSCQYIGGHFKPTPYSASFNAGMQHSIAAIETLYQTNQLDSIPYRSALESAVLSEYDSGSWSTQDWSVRPFANQQSAVDFLSTRAALRLGLVDSSMASDIVAEIEARLQYDDFWTLSNDVATLALLESNSFDVDFDSINTTAVLDGLESSFTQGWFNSSHIWQPLFTADILRLISTLGLRLRLTKVTGTRLVTAAADTVSLGDNMAINLDITSNLTQHTVQVHAFDSWTTYEDVSSNDVIYLSIPTDEAILGPLNVTVAARDYGATRAYSMESVTVIGTLTGQLDVTSSRVLQGYDLTGTVTWEIGTGIDAGDTNLTVSLHNETFNEESFYANRISPFDFEASTIDYSEGNYTLEITLDKPYCEQLILTKEITIIEPVSTDLEASNVSNGHIGESLMINYTLTFSCNGTAVEHQLVTLQITNWNDVVIHTDSMISSASGNTFEWIPAERGNYTYILQTENNGTIEGTATGGFLDVFEETSLEWQLQSEYQQYEKATLTTQLFSEDGSPLSGFWISIEIVSPSNDIEVGDYQTNSTGHISMKMELNENGNYDALAFFEAADYLKGSQNESSFISFSSSNLTFLSPIGLSPLITDDIEISILLEDSNATQISNAVVSVEIMYLPSSVVYYDDFVTNSSGLVSLTWSPTTAGDYRIDARFDGSISRGAESSHVNTTVRIPVILAIDIPDELLCGEYYQLTIYAHNHLSNPIDGLEVSIEILLPNGTIVEFGGTTSGGCIDFQWSPSIRGVSDIVASSERQNVHEAASNSKLVDVFDRIVVDIQWSEDPLAPSTNHFMIHLADSYASDLEGVEAGISILMNGVQILSTVSSTSQLGTISLETFLDEPGMAIIEVAIEEQDYLLECSDSLSSQVLGISQLSLESSGMPITQGTTLGVVGELIDWADEPLAGEAIELVITQTSVGEISSVNLTVGEYGEFVYAYQFDDVGDFQITAIYSGSDLNTSATSSFVQRVHVIPRLTLEHELSCMMGQDTELSILVQDALGNSIPNRSMSLSIEMDGQMVFEVNMLSGTNLKHVHWTPAQRGIAFITLVHSGDDYYLENTTESTMPVMAEVDGLVQLNDTSCDVFDMVQITYNLTGETETDGVSIVFEVLDVNLIPLWTVQADTNGYGIVSATYKADDTYGSVTVRARPHDDQYLIGGESQKQLIIKTKIDMNSLVTNPISHEETNVTIEFLSELGTPIDGITVDLSLLDPYGESVDLGGWLGGLSLSISEGSGYFSFISEVHGYHTLSVSFGGSPRVYAFENESMLMIYSRTFLSVNCTGDLEVGDTVKILAGLTDYEEHALVNMNLTVELSGPRTIDPVVLRTNATGHIHHSEVLDEEGLWQVKVRFAGLGAYLGKTTTSTIDVRYGTNIQVEILEQSEVIAGVAPLNMTLFLVDSGGFPLEGRDIVYSVYHSETGFVFADEVEQYSEVPENLSISFTKAGNHTIIFKFLGTDHYHPSSTTEVVFVKGTTLIAIDGPAVTDRANNDSIALNVLDETGVSMSSLEGLSYSISGPTGNVSLEDRTAMNATSLQIFLNGLQPGAYQLTAVFEETSLRLGTNIVFQFNMTTATRMLRTHEQLSGNLGEKHSLTFALVDSMNESIPNGEVSVRLHNPDGKEIYGNFLSTVTIIELSDGEFTVNWTPTIAGNYTLSLSYTGSDFQQGCQLSVVVLSRYATSLTLVDMTEMAMFDDRIEVSIRLNRGSNKLGGAPIRFEIMDGNKTIDSQTVDTDWVGSADAIFSLEYAGDYRIVVSYLGSSVNNPCSVEGSVTLLPDVSASLTDLSDPYTGGQCTANITILAAGARNDSFFQLTGMLYGPDKSILRAVNASISRASSLIIQFSPTSTGEHLLNLTLSGLPGIGNATISIGFSVEQPPIVIPMAETAVPLGGGLGLIGVLAIAIRRRIESVVESFPEKWED